MRHRDQMRIEKLRAELSRTYRIMQETPRQSAGYQKAVQAWERVKAKLDKLEDRIA